jgi:hypothetical protein
MTSPMVGVIMTGRSLRYGQVNGKIHILKFPVSFRLSEYQAMLTGQVSDIFLKPDSGRNQ